MISMGFLTHKKSENIIANVSKKFREIEHGSFK